MPARDFFHKAVKNALIKDGWTITDDPLHVPWLEKKIYVDFGAEKLLAAERFGRKIAVEVKSFVGLSEVHDLENACGQYLFYRAILKRTDPQRALFLAVSQEVFENVFEEFGWPVLEDYPISVVIFNAQREEVVEWKT